jgi:glycosyltransferase involved in cell wall biosynthesis
MILQPIFLNTKLPGTEEGRLVLFRRWNDYGSVLVSQDSLNPIRIIVPINPSQLPENPSLFRNLWFVPTQHKSFSVIRKLNLVRNLLISSQERKYILVSGITPIDMLASVFFKFFLKDRIRLQGQFHGDTYNFPRRWVLKSLIQFLISRLIILRADSIRVVSVYQIQEINQIRRKGLLVFVAPIPIDSNLVLQRGTEKNKKLIAVVGRLHMERGVQEIVDVIGKLCTLKSDLEIEVVGDGPLRAEIENLEVRFPYNVKYWGYRDSAFLRDLYGRSSYLLSAAPSEGYGLVLREAIYNGVQVVARDSKGSRSLKELFQEHVHLYESPSAAVEVLSLLLREQTKLSTSRASFSSQEQMDALGILNLIESWRL